jgi:hypothetical protein
MIEKKLISKDWVYKNIFNFTSEDIEDIDKGLIKDQKDSFRLSKISEEGEDPANPVPKKKEEKEGEGGTESEKEANPFAEGIDEDLLKKYDKRAKDTEEDKERKKPEVPEGGWPGAGRPKETMKYNTHDHPRGYDPTGRIAWKNARNESIDLLKKKYGLNKLVSKKTGLINEQSSMLDESNIIPEEI